MSLVLSLPRDTSTPVETLGWLYAANKKWATIERPWIPGIETVAGLKGASCVPRGTYRLVPHTTEAHRNVWALVNPALDIYHWPWDVPNAKVHSARTVCLIHVANWAFELRGCIAIGAERKRDAHGRWMVTASANAINELRSVLGNAMDIQLTITETFRR